MTPVGAVSPGAKQPQPVSPSGFSPRKTSNWTELAPSAVPFGLISDSAEQSNGSWKVGSEIDFLQISTNISFFGV